MRSNKLRILLLILGFALRIQLNGQTDSGKICLTFSEFDFYAQTLVENKGLKADTADYIAQIRINNEIVSNKDKELLNQKLIVSDKDSIINVQVKAFEDLAKKYIKSEKKVNKWKSGTVGLVISTCILAIIILVK